MDNEYNFTKTVEDKTGASLMRSKVDVNSYHKVIVKSRRVYVSSIDERVKDGEGLLWLTSRFSLNKNR